MNKALKWHKKQVTESAKRLQTFNITSDNNDLFMYMLCEHLKFENLNNNEILNLYLKRKANNELTNKSI